MCKASLERLCGSSRAQSVRGSSRDTIRSLPNLRLETTFDTLESFPGRNTYCRWVAGARRGRAGRDPDRDEHFRRRFSLHESLKYPFGIRTYPNWVSQTSLGFGRERKTMVLEKRDRVRYRWLSYDQKVMRGLSSSEKNPPPFGEMVTRQSSGPLREHASRRPIL